MEGALDAANILKPALAKGTLHCIGATTYEEYEKHMQVSPPDKTRNSHTGCPLILFLVRLGR